MGYDAALTKAWQELEPIAKETKYSVRVLSDEYDIDLTSKTIYSRSCNIPAKVYVSILILHYLVKGLNSLPGLKEDWISFHDLSGGEGYYPVFKKRVIDAIVRKYGDKPEALSELTERFKAKKAQIADVSVVIEVFEGVPILITLQRGDDEFGPEANILFDASIKEIFCTEDTVVLSELLVYTI